MKDRVTPLTYTVLPEDEGRRIRQILLSKLGLSHTLLQRLKEHERVLLNGLPVFLNQTARSGDQLSVDISFNEETLIIPEKMDLNILYEDDEFLVINKPPGILVHPVGKEQTGTLANGVIYYWQTHDIQAKFRPIHRLDRKTSGLVLIGKNQFAHQHLFRQMVNRTVFREYLAIAAGALTPETGIINAPIARKPGSTVERIVAPEGQEAITHYKVIRCNHEASLLSLHLETGRTHQIRVHLNYLGHPLLGDTLYGGSDGLIRRQALHSHQIRFIHPRFQEAVTFTAPLAADMQELLHTLNLSS